MKKILYSFLSFAALTLVGCDYNNPNDGRFGNEPQSGWVQFEDESVGMPTYVLSGASAEFTVPVQLSAPVNKDGVTVNYTIADVDGGSASSLLTYTGEMEIPANSLVGYITFGLPAEAFTSCASFEITLTGTSDSNVTVGIATEDGNAKPVKHTVTIGKGRDSFIGNYTSLESTGVVSIAAGDKPNEIVVTNLLNLGSTFSLFLDISSYGGHVTFPYFTENYLTTDATVGNQYAADVVKQGALVTKSDNNFFNPCSNTFDLNFVIVDVNGKLVSDAVATLSPQ